MAITLPNPPAYAATCLQLELEAALPATPGSERAREPESQGERGEHQDASRNTDREISAFLQKHNPTQSFWTFMLSLILTRFFDWN